MPLRYFMVALIVFLAPGMAGAEFYKYRDANGVLRFTDDITEVPVDQRVKLKEYQSVVTPEPSTADTDEQKGQDPAQDGELSAMAKSLEAEKTALEQEYQAIMEADRRIKASVADPENPADPEAYNKQLKELHQKIQAYDVRRKAFQEKASAFDAKMKK